MNRCLHGFGITLAVVLVSLLGGGVGADAADLGDGILRDYPCALPLKKGRVELSLDYLRIDEGTDVFDFRDREWDNIASAYRIAGVSDLEGARGHLNWGWRERTTLMSSVAYRNLDYSFSTLDIYSLDLGVKQSLWNRTNGFWPLIVLDVGVRYDVAPAEVVRTERDLNLFLDRLDPRAPDVRLDPLYVWFDYKKNGNRVSLGVPRTGRPDPYLRLDDMQAVTPYARLTLGKIWGSVFPNAYAEYGYSSIDSRIDSSLTAYVPDEFTSRIPALPLDLDRSESYLKVGLSVLLKLPYRFTAYADFSQIEMFRDAELQYVDYNHVFRADLHYYASRNVVLTLGGVIYERQLNGVLPFLYNEYTQTTFDHAWGRLNLGVTVMFD